MSKKTRRVGKKSGRRQGTEKERPWLIPVLVFLAAVTVIALALVASKGG